jgi:hypothetical protein
MLNQNSYDMTSRSEQILLKTVFVEVSMEHLKLYRILRPVIAEVSDNVTMKNAAFWDIKTQFILHRRHIMSLLQSPAG